ncbi:zinc finger protein MEP-1 isoform X2 [Leptinotarsa decemlineata]
MADIADMGEVDEMHSKEEGSIVTNGDLSNDIEMETQDSQDSLKKSSLPDSVGMEYETIETKDNQPENVSAMEDSNEETENTAEEVSSVATERQSEVNEDDISQETKMSDDQTEDSEAIDRENSQASEDVREKSEVDEEENNSRHSAKESEKSEVRTEDEVHEIESDDEDHGSSKNKISNDEPIELNDSGGEGDGDIMIVDIPKENGTSEVIDLASDATPEKKVIEKRETVTPRRSSRNLNKSRSYVESDKEEEGSNSPPEHSEESDVEEVLPQDPLACGDSVTIERVPIEKPKIPGKSATIVVKDTKRLVEIASKSNNTTQGKKEPTLVIIDTNSILSGHGPVPVNNKPAPIPKPTPSPITTHSYTNVLPKAVPAQGMYPPNMRATITPIPINSSNLPSTAPVKTAPATITPTLTTPLLPTLTDDMFVVEAPSFIVPYVYEKPPVKDFKAFIKTIQEQILERLKNEKEEEEKADDKESEDGDKKEEKVEDEKMETNEEESKKDKSDPLYEPKKGVDEQRKPYSYFDSPLGKFFINIGFNLVQEYVQTDLLKQQKRKHSREGGANAETEKTIKSLMKNLQYSKSNNEHFKTDLKKCEFCNFKTESSLAMSYHLETPHMKNFVYKCNFCAYEVRSPHDILFHMEAEHAVRGHLERAPAFHQCPNCPFEDNQKGKLSRHLVTCTKKFKPERNLEPPVDWEPPAKIPRVPKMRQQGLNATAAAYQAMSKTSQYQFLSKMQLQSTQNALNRGRGRPSLGTNMAPKPQTMIRPSGMVFKPQASMSGGSVLVPTSYQLSGNQVFQVVGGQEIGGRLGNPGHMFLPNMPSASSTMAVQNQAKKPSQQPSISITPLPRGTSSTVSPSTPAKPGDTTTKNSFVVCEICDGYIKDLEQLRNHMQWIHKIKIHPKMIYNRPPLNCQKCQFRFFTDQGLERHLLGSHGLVTSSMQDAANKSKDSGRCPVCGRVYQWKLLNHVARDHNTILKPAHLSYKCTVCTATFGMYKQFENHVYSAHSVVAKRVMDKKATPSPAGKSEQLKSLKINDEITIIPQPAKSTNGATKEGSPASTGSSNSKNSTPSTSKNPDSTGPGTSRAERLARRNASEGV